MKRFLPLLILALLSLPLTSSADEGEDAFLSECAGCHGPVGTGTAWAPSIFEEGGAGADLMMRTGRMPLRRPDDPILRGPQKLTDDQIAAIARYVSGLGGPAIPDPQPQAGDIGLGSQIYLINCAVCHGATGVGAALVHSDNAPSILPAGSLDIAEAVRSGPLSMPAFSEDSIDAHQLDSLVAYVSAMSEGRARGGWSLGRWGPVAEGAAAWLVGVVAVIGAARWIEGGRGTEEEPDGEEEEREEEEEE